MTTERALQWAAAGSHLALIALLTAWVTWLAPPPEGLIAPVLLVAVAPLAAGVRGMLDARAYTFGWTSLLMTIYLVHATAMLGSPGTTRWLALAELLLALVVFSTCVAANWLRRRARQAAQRDGDGLVEGDY